VVDDFSSTPLEPIENTTIIRHTSRLGVGQAFDSGVKQAKYDNIILMAADTRYKDNGWAELLYDEIQLYPTSLVSTTCIGDNYRHTGATILIFHDHISNPRKPKYFRGLVEAKWLPTFEGESREIPCILGACYAVKKDWYQHIDGFWGHRIWGSLESYISMKSYLFGGSCRCVPRAETYHIFKPRTTNVHKIPQEDVLYNKLLIATLLFPDSRRLISFLGTDPNVWRANMIFQKNSALIQAKKQEYLLKTKMSMEEYVRKFNLDYRK
jgi:glycosyltransferase involved in cell wall biosynthesis